MWISDKDTRWMVNTDNVCGFTVEGDRTIIMFDNGQYLEYLGEAVIPTVIRGIERESKVVYVGGDLNV